MLSRGTFQTLNNNTTKPQGKTLDVNSTLNEMADNYIDRLTAMNGKYRLGESTFKYISQVKISHIIKGRDLEPKSMRYLT